MKNLNGDLISGILAKYLKMSGIRLSRRKILEYLSTQTLRNSLRGISDTLDEFHIPHMVVEIGRDDLHSLEGPLLVEIKDNRHPFVVLEKNQGESIRLLMPDGSNKTISVDIFNSLWTGKVIGLEKDENTVEQSNWDYHLSNIIFFIETNSLKLLAGSLSISALSLIITFRQDLPAYIYLALKVVGLVISVAILYKTYVKKDFLHRLCNAFTKTDCNDVLKSKGAKLFGWIGLGELSFVYFMGSIFWGLTVGNPTSLFALFSIFTSLIVVFSIGYQIYIKQWCILCLLIDLVLIGELAVTLSFRVDMIPEPNLVIGYLSLMSAILLGCIIYIKNYKDSLKLSRIEPARASMITDPNIFRYLLSRNSREISYSREMLSNIKGKEFPSILFVTNPSCPHCARLYNEIVRLYESYNIYFIMTTYAGDELGFRRAISTIKQYNKAGLFEAIKYLESEQVDEHVNKENFEHYKCEVEVLKKHMELFINMELKGIPALFLNGHQIPLEIYEPSELKYVL